MTDMEAFKDLKMKYNLATEYFRTKYEQDTEANKAKAKPRFETLQKAPDTAFEKIRYKTLEFTEPELEMIASTIEAPWVIEKAQIYTVSKRLVLSLKLPEFMKIANEMEG